uniref:Interferon phi 1 n=1 Tax=Oncorhynchus mykiss TaxID=8022 RepID=A0A8C7URN5_ONCMY
MGGDITKQNAPVLFPTSLYRHIDDAEFEDKVIFLKETIYQITKLFDGNMKSVTWDKKNLDDFLNILERQLENLNSCVSAINTDLSTTVRIVNTSLSVHFVTLKFYYITRERYGTRGAKDVQIVRIKHIQKLSHILSSK